MDEGAKKNLKIGVSVVVLLGAAGYAWSVLKTEEIVAMRSGFVCVETGEIFDLAIKDVAMIPAKNRNTGRWTLIPCVTDESGRMVVGSHYRRVILNELKELNNYVDESTLEVRTAKGS